MRHTALALGVMGLVWSTAATAQSSSAAIHDLQRFVPPGGAHGFAAVRTGLIARPNTASYSFVATYAHTPLVPSLVYEDELLGHVDGGMRGLLALHAYAGYAPLPWLELAFSAPILERPFFGTGPRRYLDGDTPLALGDVRLEGRFAVLNQRDHAVNAEVSPYLTIPSGAKKVMLSSGVPTFGAVAAVSRRWERVHAAGHAGYGIKPGFATVGADFASDDPWTYGVGVGVTPWRDRLDVNVEAVGGGYAGPGVSSIRDLASANLVAALHAPLEVYADARVFLDGGWSVVAGGGPGVTPSVGNPSFRVFAGVSWRAEAGDSDGDGYDDDHDLCPFEPEDFDGFEDDDGCPDPDNDGDGILDVVDDCPMIPEDFDGWEDLDGCPEADNDGDGYLDPVDDCPNDPEDFDGFEDDDGCPEPDNDLDGFLDPVDDCPNDPETFNGFEDDDGCPDEVVVLTKEQIVILQRIEFYTDEARLRPESTPVLEAVRDVLVDHPELLRVRIEGHTDWRASDAYNLRLSQRRSEAVVDWLVDHGVERDRLRGVGFGESRPRATNETVEGMAENRRVEFHIVEQTGEGAD